MPVESCTEGIKCLYDMLVVSSDGRLLFFEEAVVPVCPHCPVDSCYDCVQNGFCVRGATWEAQGNM